jgi:hypothetical protein
MKLLPRPRCPACGSDAAVPIYERSYADPEIGAYFEAAYPRFSRERFTEATRDASFQIARCPACTMVFQVMVPDGELLAEIYDRWCDAEASCEKTRGKLDGGRNAKLIQDALILGELAGGRASEKRALDFGAGWGAWCTAARAIGFEVAATDLGEDRRAALGTANIPILASSELGTASFDVINCEQVFEHLVDPFESIGRLGAALKPNGVLRISVPHGGLARARLRVGRWDAGKAALRSLNFVAPLEHLNAFTERALVALAARVGLAPISAGIGADYRHLVASGSLAKALLRPVYFRVLGRNLTKFFRPA